MCIMFFIQRYISADVLNEKLLVGNVRKHIKVKSEIQERNDLIFKKKLLFIQIISMLVVNDHIILC